MDDLKSVTVSYLKELARKHLGTGYSKLTKTQLIAALARFVPALEKLARSSGIELPRSAKSAPKAPAAAAKSAPRKSPAATKPSREPARKEPEKRAPEKKAQEKRAPEKKPQEKRAPEKKAQERRAPEKKPQGKQAPEKKPQEKQAPEKQATLPQPPKAAARRAPAPSPDVTERSPKPAQVVNFPPRSRSARYTEEFPPEEFVEGEAPRQPEAPAQHAAEPLVEGFFVARMVGERELRRHHLTEEQAPRVMSEPTGYDENLGELPLDYGSDLVMALAKDPHTLFIAWDFSSLTRGRILEGLEEPRAFLRVYDGEKLARVEEFALESRSFYIHGLPPGRTYRVEAHLVGKDGRSRRLGHSTHRLSLPQTGPSPDKAVRFMRMPPPPVYPPPAAPPPNLPQQVEVATPPAQAPVAEEREYITWRRVPLPGSEGMVEVPETRRERLTPDVPPDARPQPEHLEVAARPLGSSEQPLERAMGPSGPSGPHLELPTRPPGSSEEYLEVAARPQGSSEQYLEITTRPPGSSEQYLELPTRPLGSSEQHVAGGGSQGGASGQTHWTPPQSGRGR